MAHMLCVHGCAPGDLDVQAIEARWKSADELSLNGLKATSDVVAIHDLLNSSPRKASSKLGGVIRLAQMPIDYSGQVLRYVASDQTRLHAAARISSALNRDTRVVIGYSLGGVATLEAIAGSRYRHQRGLLITLGFPRVLSLMPSVRSSVERLLQCGTWHWINVMHAGDPVVKMPRTLQAGLRGSHTNVTDGIWRGPRAAHSVSEYLATVLASPFVMERWHQAMTAL